MSERRPYRRPMRRQTGGRKPPYRAYTLRELSGVAVAIYGARAVRRPRQPCARAG